MQWRVVSCQLPVNGFDWQLTTGNWRLHMKLSDLTPQAGEWLRGSGPMSEIVISSRIRLARNVAGLPVPHPLHAPRSARPLEHKVRDTILDASIAPQTLYVDLDSAPEIDRQLLVERHLISKPHAAAEGARGVAIGENETVSIMVNEEDHLRIQVLRSGLQLEEAWEQINADRRPARIQARLRLPPALRLPDRLPDQRRHRHSRQRDAAPARAEAHRRNRKGLPRRQGHAPGRPRPLRRRHRSHRRFLPDQQPDHARQERRRNHQRLQAPGDPQDHRLRAPRPPNAAATTARSRSTTRSAAPWACSAPPG